jgi:hypothetical protein
VIAMTKKGMTKTSVTRSRGSQHSGIRSLRLAGLLTAALALMMLGAGVAQANSPIAAFSTTASTSQAGGHPNITISYKTGTRGSQGYANPCFCNDPKTITRNLPAGVIGNPHVTPQCETVDFGGYQCPVDSQIGVVALLLLNELGTPEATQYYVMPLFNLVPHPGEAGLIGFFTPIGTPIFTELSARTGSDYGLIATTTDIEHIFPPYGVSEYLWGVPADSSHDVLRFPAGEGVSANLQFGCGISTDPRQALEELKFPQGCLAGVEFDPNPSSTPPAPFLSNPTLCSGVLTSTLDSLSYDLGTDHAETTYPAITGCQQLSFNPSLSAKPTTTEADSASGLDVDLSVPQLESPDTPSPSEIKATTVTLPKGFSINPNAADGKTSCSDLEGSFGTENAANCPEFAKVGTLSLESSALPGPIPGAIYLGDPKPGDRYRIILAADGFATHVKLAGSVIPDPQTGQLVTSFQNLPQSPLTEFKLHFFGSERGLLATPNHCGTYAVHSTFTPWDEALPAQSATQFFTLDSGPGGSPCPGSSRPFDPSFEAASAGNTAGAHSPFSINLSRGDGEQNLTGLDITTPPGFAATLKGIPYCPEAALGKLSALGYTGLSEQAAPSCPAASQVGSASAGAGAGTHPLYTPGKVYLAGPYKGAPLSLEVVIPAVSGPYDLGTVAVRAAIKVDPASAQVSAASDPLPQILDGIPLRIRSIQVNLDRKDFALNPTNCDPLSVNTEISGEEGAKASPSAHFQVANCANLPFGPKLSLKLGGSIKRRGHPTVRAVVQANPGEANIASTVVAMPEAEQLDNAHIGTVCTRVQFAANTCPDGSLIGEAEAITPLLDQPLKGSVYLRAGGHKLPDLVMALKGQFDIELVGRIDSANGGLRTSFETVPDAPVSSFVLNLKGGSKGLLINSENLCKSPQKAAVKIGGQNGALLNRKTKLQTSCGSSASRHKRHQKRLYRAKEVR